MQVSLLNMVQTALIRNDILDLIVAECTGEWQYSLPLQDIEPRLLDNLMGTLLVMIPIVFASYYFWQLVGWV